MEYYTVILVLVCAGALTIVNSLILLAYTLINKLKIKSARLNPLITYVVAYTIFTVISISLFFVYMYYHHNHIAIIV